MFDYWYGAACWEEFVVEKWANFVVTKAMKWIIHGAAPAAQTQSPKLDSSLPLCVAGTCLLLMSFMSKIPLQNVD